VASVDEILERIEAKTELNVARRDGDVWIDRILPEPAWTAEESD
jgi:hypothetical protein